MGRAETITVEVAHARPERQLILVVQVPAGATLEQAIRASGILEQFPDIDLAGSNGMVMRCCISVKVDKKNTGLDIVAVILGSSTI